MKLERINENQIRCILNHNDNEDKELLDGFMFKNPSNIKKFFHKIVKQAQEKLDFNIGSSPITIESSFRKENEIEFIISKAPIDDSPLKDSNELNDKSNRDDIIEADRLSVFEFKGIHHLSYINKSNINFSDLYNSLYRSSDGNDYYLLVKRNNLPLDVYEQYILYIEEYGLKTYNPTALESFYNEHYELVYKGNALQRIQLL